MTTTIDPASSPAGPSTSSDAVRPESGHHPLALFVISCAQLMIILDATIVNVAIPTIHRALNFSSANLEWLITAYALTFGGLLLFGGRTGDLFGKRRMFMVGVAIFSVASLLGGLATDQAWLIVTRGLQGVGGAIASPTALSLIATNFPEGRQRNRAMGVYAAMSGAGGAVGLLLGGILTTYVSWRWIFFVNVPIGALVIALAPRALRESAGTRGRLDVGGALTATGGMVSLVYGLTNASTHSWASAGTVAPVVAAVALLLSFVVLEFRHPAPLMPVRIFANRNRSGAYGLMLLLGTAVFSMFFFLTQFFQNIHGYSAVRTGVAFLPMTVSIVIAAGLMSRFVARLGVRIPLLVGPGLALVGLYLLTRITPTSGYGTLVVSLVLIAFGMGLSFVPVTLSAVSGVAPEEAGIASALLNTAQQVGGALGLAVLGTVAISSARSSLTGALGAAHGHLTKAAQHLAQLSATTHGYAEAFWVATGLALAGVILSWLVIRVDHTSVGSVPAQADARAVDARPGGHAADGLDGAPRLRPTLVPVPVSAPIE